MDSLQKKAGRWNFVLLAGAMICLVCYDIFSELWLKGVTSMCFFVLGMFNLAYAKKQDIKEKRFLILIVLGLFFGMCADVLLGVHFIFGILFFALGHVLYLIAFYSLKKFQWKELLVIMPAALISLYVVTALPIIQIEDPILKKILLGYAVIIACVLGKAVSNFMEKKCMSTGFILLGSIMFWFSDVMLAIDMFGQSSRMTWILCSYTYWPAQNILAHSLYYFVNEQKTEIESEL